MKKGLFLALIGSILLLTKRVYAQSAAHSSKGIAMADKPSHKRIVKKRARKLTILYEYQTNAPDSILKKVDKASQKLAQMFATGLKPIPGDSVYKLSTWTSYQSKVIGASTQVSIDINCTLTHNKNRHKAPAKQYTINYRADNNIYRIAYDSHTRKSRVTYNESYWPGYMYNDKAPTKAQLDHDISLAMDHIIHDKITLQ